MRAARSFQRGQASIETAVVMGLLILVIVLIIEATHWWLMRQHCLYALAEGLRQGSVRHARMQAIQDGFEQALAARFVRAQAQRQPRAALRDHGQRFQQRHQLSFYRLTRHHPSASDFQTFADHDARGQTRIRADFFEEQIQQLSTEHALGLAQALSLTVELHYLHEPWSALLRQLLATQARLQPHPDPWVQQARQQGLLLIRRQLSLPMHSDPIAESRSTHAYFGGQTR